MTVMHMNTMMSGPLGGYSPQYGHMQQPYSQYAARGAGMMPGMLQAHQAMLSQFNMKSHAQVPQQPMQSIAPQKLSSAHPPQPSPPPVSDPPAPVDPKEGILVPDCLPGGTPSVQRPCLHNDWDDVRTRKGSKILRCRLCQRKWKLASSTVPRCASFLQNICPNGLQCAYLHVHKKKSHAAAEGEGEAEGQLMPQLAAGTPDNTPPVSPSMLLHALRNLGAKPDACSPVHTDTRELLAALRKAGWGRGVISSPPSPSGVSRRHSSMVSLGAGIRRRDSNALGLRASRSSIYGLGMRCESADMNVEHLGKEILACSPPSPREGAVFEEDELFLQSLGKDAGSPRGIAARRGRPNLDVAVQSPSTGPNAVVGTVHSPAVVMHVPTMQSPTEAPGAVKVGKLEFHQIADFLYTPHSMASPHGAQQMLVAKQHLMRYPAGAGNTTPNQTAGSLSGSDQSPNDNYIPSPGSSVSSPSGPAGETF